MDTDIVNAYTDGSLIRKGRLILCGYGIYFPGKEHKPLSKEYTHEPITNNRAELYAILKTIHICVKLNLDRIKENKNQIKILNIYSDSEYSVKTFNEWLPKWKISKKEYMNKDIIDAVDYYLESALFKINFIHVRAHTGKKDIHSLNNEIVDKLARDGALKLLNNNK